MTVQVTWRRLHTAAFVTPRTALHRHLATQEDMLHMEARAIDIYKPKRVSIQPGMLLEDVTVSGMLEALHTPM